MKQEDLDLLAQMLEDQPELLEMEATAPMTPEVKGSTNIKGKTRIFDQNVDNIARSLGDEAVDVADQDLQQKALEKAKSFLTEARTRASMKGSNPEMYKKLGREALEKSKEALKGVAKSPGKLLKGIGGPMLFLASEAADAAEAGPSQGSDEAIMENPSLPLEVRQAAMKRVKDKYLKPKEDRDE